MVYDIWICVLDQFLSDAFSSRFVRLKAKQLFGDSYLGGQMKYKTVGFGRSEVSFWDLTLLKCLAGNGELLLDVVLKESDSGEFRSECGWFRTVVTCLR